MKAAKDCDLTAFYFGAVIFLSFFIIAIFYFGEITLELFDHGKDNTP